MRFKLICILLLCVTAMVSSQTMDDKTLFTIDKEPVMTSEFLRVYNKNLDLVKDESQKDVDGYLDLFINYKLKLKEAKTLEFDKKPQYIREFNGYKQQLAKNYLTDHNVTDALVKEAYERISEDVKVSHILVRLPEHVTDTVKVYQQMLAYRDRLIAEDFETVQKDVHDGNTVFAEDLGYFSGFKMVYDFENVAYTTPIGDVSMPFRTQFGYHVLKVFDKRKSRGTVTVGHIMISNTNSDSIADPANRIQEIYKMIQQGENFESLAKQFSEDKSSAKKGGKLTPFKSGQLNSVKFEDKAFSLTSQNQMSEPFESDYGWHIVKLYQKMEIEPYEKLKSQLENRVKRDSRSKLINSAFIENLKAKYKVDIKNIDLAYFVSQLDDSYFSHQWVAPTGIPQDKPFFQIGIKSFNYYDFGTFLQAAQKRIRDVQPYEKVIQTQFDEFLNESILKYHEENLESENKEYAHVLNEYREGLLLFDLMETKIWNAVKKDSAGLLTYYENHKNKYVWQERIDAVVVTGSDRKHIKKAKEKLESGMDITTLKAQINTSERQNIIVTSGVMTADHQALSKNVKFSKGVSDVYNYNDAFHVILVKDVLPSAEKTLEEAKGNVISDYQIQVEDEWLQSLKSKYKVSINKKVLNSIKSQINN